MNNRKLIATGIVLLVEILFIVYLIPSNVVWVCLGIGAATASYFLLMATRSKRSRSGEGSRMINMLPILSVVLPLFFGWLSFHLGYFAPLLAVLLTALTIDFFSNFLALPLCLYHKYLEDKISGKEIASWPSVTVIVPAHNEEKMIERCIESLLEVDYPKKEIIVIDDGSTDQTCELATKFEKRGVKVFSRTRAGGKSVALNTGILFAKGEIIVTCDADSLISRSALRMIMRRFEDPMINAVAGNVEVLNRTNVVTKCQALEYIINENIFRRVFDLFGVVPVVPGPLAAFRKSALKEIGVYDRDTITEDFDVTVKVLKTGKVVQALSNAYVYTEAPTTWKDLYKQRIRWNRGTFQTLIKHKNVFGNPRFGFVHNLAFPYLLLSMLFIPFASVVSIISTIAALSAGLGLSVFYVMIGFILLHATYSFLALQMDNEDLRLLVFSPLFVVGYKEVLSFIKIKSFIDILFKKETKWGEIKRIGRTAEPIRNTAAQMSDAS